MAGKYQERFLVAMRARKLERGWSYAQLSGQLRLLSVRLSPQSLKQIEIGKRHINVDELVGIATVMGLDLMSILDEGKVRR